MRASNHSNSDSALEAAASPGFFPLARRTEAPRVGATGASDRTALVTMHASCHVRASQACGHSALVAMTAAVAAALALGLRDRCAEQSESRYGSNR